MSNLRYPCLYFSQQFVVYNSFYVHSTATGIFSNSCRCSAFLQVWLQDLNGFHRKSSSHLWKISLPPSPPHEMTHLSTALLQRKGKKPLFLPGSIKPSWPWDHLLFLSAILHLIHYAASIPFDTHHCFISPQRAEKQECQWEMSIWPLN